MGRPTFEVTKRAQPGQRQYADVAAGYNRGQVAGPYAQATQSGNVIVPYAGAAVTQPSFMGPQTDPRMGYDNNPWGARLTQPEQSGWSSGAGYVAPQSFTDQFKGYTNQQFENDYFKYGQPPTPVADPAGIRQRITSADRAMEQIGAGTGSYVPPTTQQIGGIIGGVYADFQTQQVKWQSLRDQAMADGQEEVADAYQSKVTDIERQMAEMQREIDSSVSVESWFRDRIQKPYEDAKAAALAVDTQPILDLAPEALQRQVELAGEKNARMDGILADLGFTPEQAAALREGAVQDNAVLAAEGEVLAALGTRPGLLDARKQLAFHTADAERLEHMRTSAGSQLVVTEVNRRKLAQSKDQLAEIDVLKAKALARTKRAVERSFGDGPQLPSIDEFRDTAVEDVLRSLAGDLPPAVQDFYRQLVGDAIYNGVTEITPQYMIDQIMAGNGVFGSIDITAFMDGLAERPGMLTLDAKGNPIGWSQAGLNDIKSYIQREVFDDEDYGVINTMISTYGSAGDTFSQMLQKNLSRQGPTGENQNPQNVADAKSGVGIYGLRAREVDNWVSRFKSMFGSKYVTGVQAGFRDINAVGGGQVANSDHKTGGAVDMFIDYNNKAAMAYYETEIRPFLDTLYRGGQITTLIHPGDNVYHMDHAHISFALDGVNDAFMAVP